MRHRLRNCCRRLKNAPRALYRVFWGWMLDQNQERAWLEVERLSWQPNPPTAEELRVWRKRATRYNLVYHNMKRSSSTRRDPHYG
jgi:hypothetical protein